VPEGGDARPDRRRGFDSDAWLSGANPFLWALLAAASASHASAAFFANAANFLAPNDSGKLPAPLWTTANTVALELSTMRLRDFSTPERGQATLVCAPYALHGATIVDFAPGHSVVQALRKAGVARLFVTDWRSATPPMRYFSIDSYLADLNVAVDEIGAPVDLIGLCQGGWLALVYAARFPEKVRRLVLAGAPIDIRAGHSQLSRMAVDAPAGAFETLVDRGGGRVLGRDVLALWAPALAADDVPRILQVPVDIDRDRLRELETRFAAWYAWTLDMPGTYFLQVARRLFKENQIAEGRFVALGHPVDLARVRAPMFLLAARDDEIVGPSQLLVTAGLVGTPKGAIQTTTEPCGHLSLFLGARTIEGTWQRIGHWLGRSPPSSKDIRRAINSP
jgi:poly(3-hydroxyalkanoate) synthetase